MRRSSLGWTVKGRLTDPDLQHSGLIVRAMLMGSVSALPQIRHCDCSCRCVACVALGSRRRDTFFDELVDGSIGVADGFWPQLHFFQLRLDHVEEMTLADVEFAAFG